MEKKNAVTELMGSTMESIKTIMDANTIIGAPIHADGVTLIPVSRLSLGVACGDSDFSTKSSQGNFGGGSGSSVKVDPVAFLVIRGESVRLLPVNPPPATTVDRVIDTVPEVVDKVTGFIEKQQEKKAQASVESDFAE